MYLEVMPEARVIYERFGYRVVGEEGTANAMIRNPAPGVRLLEGVRHEEKKERWETT
jgi:hypothetical protein